MKTQIEALQDNQVKLTVTVEAADVDARINKTYKDFAKKYRFPGFRPGKAPRPIIDNALGSQAVVAKVTEDLVNETYPLAVDAEDLYVVGRPEFTDEELLAEEGKNLTYDVVVSVSRPSSCPATNRSRSSFLPKRRPRRKLTTSSSSCVSTTTISRMPPPTRRSRTAASWR